MEAALVNPFVEGTLYILDTTASVKAKPGKPFLKKRADAQGDICGILEITGDISGSARVSFSEKSILGIVSSMFGEEMTRIDDEIKDAVGEIGNMISGHVNTKMTELGKNVRVKLSGVAIGSQELPAFDPMAQVLVLPFLTTKGNLVVEVCFS
ncbi:MAG: chemotaxis protein CheX [Pseudomonadota bacterium]